MSRGWRATVCLAYVLVVAGALDAYAAIQSAEGASVVPEHTNGRGLLVSKQPECSGHGTIETNGHCKCTGAFPGVGERGWTGETCSTPVFGTELPGDVTAICAKQGECNHLKHADETVCFFAALDTSQAWNFLTLQLRHTSGLGDPDLYGFFTQSTTRNAVFALDRVHSDFVDVSTTAFQQGPVSLKREYITGRMHGATPSGVLLCVYNFQGFDIEGYGYDVEEGNDYSIADADLLPSSAGASESVFTLAAATTACAASFDADNGLLVCSTPVKALGGANAHGVCRADGTCECVGENAPPAATAYPDAGFADCSARVFQVQNGSVADAVTAYQQAVTQPVRTMYYWRVVLPDTYSQLRALARVEDTAGASVSVMLKHGALPGKNYGEYDVRSWFEDYKADRNDRYVQVDRNTTGFRPGVWWLGVYVGMAPEGHAAVDYELVVDANECVNGCSGHGRCVFAEARGHSVCQCDANHFNGDCSGGWDMLRWDSAVRDSVSGGIDYWQLGPAEIAGLQSDFRITLKLTGDTWMAPYSASSLLVQIGGAKDVPTEQRFSLKRAIEGGKETVLHVCDSMISPNDHVNVGVASLDPFYSLNYTLTATQEVGCRHGALQPQHVPEKHGTCWRQCECTALECKFNQRVCVHFTCDSGGSAAYRKHGSRDECIVDECTEHQWIETDEYVCLKQCRCGSDGGACRPQKGCDAARFQCKAGFERAGSSLACRRATGQLQQGGRTNPGKVGGLHTFGWCMLTAAIAGTLGWAAHVLHLHPGELRPSLLWARVMNKGSSDVELQGYTALS